VPFGRNSAQVLQSCSALARDGAEIAYEVHASGRIGAPKVALVHSLALDRSVWDGVVAELAGEADVLTVDCRGHGASAKTAGPYTTAQFAGDLADVLRAAGWERAIVAGASMGGSVTLNFAIDYPAMIAGLGLIDTTAWYGPDAPQTWHERGQKALDGGLASLVGFQVSRWFSDGFRAERPDVVEKYTGVFLKNAPATYAATCDMLGNLDVRAGLPAIAVPVEILVGSEDYATPPTMAEALAAAIPGAQLTLVEGARHLTPIEIPGRVAELLRVVIERSGAGVANRR
jgi:3-oxoadipate enol-lactonase